MFLGAVPVLFRDESDQNGSVLFGSCMASSVVFDHVAFECRRVAFVPSCRCFGDSERKADVRSLLFFMARTLFSASATTLCVQRCENSRLRENEASGGVRQHDDSRVSYALFCHGRQSRIGAGYAAFRPCDSAKLQLWHSFVSLVMCGCGLVTGCLEDAIS